MATPFQFTILTPSGNPFTGEVESVRVKADDGYLGVMANHAPLVALIQPGVARLRETGGKERFFAVTGGVLETGSDHGLLLLADTAEEADNADAAAARLDEVLAEMTG